MAAGGARSDAVRAVRRRPQPAAGHRAAVPSAGHGARPAARHRAAAHRRTLRRQTEQVHTAGQKGDGGGEGGGRSGERGLRVLRCKKLVVCFFDFFLQDKLHGLRSSYTMRTKCAISDAFVRDCVFAYCASVAQYVYSLSAEHCFRLRNNAISDERFRDCALSTYSVFRPLTSVCKVRIRTIKTFLALGRYCSGSGFYGSGFYCIDYCECDSRAVFAAVLNPAPI